MYRDPIVAGQFYAGYKDELLYQIKECFDHILGVGEKDPAKGKEVVSLISPHAGYMFSGPTASWSYASLRNSKVKKFIILGPNHRGLGKSPALCSFKGWKTPLGIAKVDESLNEKLAEKLAVDDMAHIYEHSIEVQLPFLQYIFKDNFSFVPISVMYQDESEFYKVLNALKEVEEEFIIIASSDLSHYVSKEEAKKKDNYIIEAIKEQKALEVINRVKKFDITACGYLPIAVAVEWGNYKKATPKILSYTTSGDVYPMDDVVAYLSAIFVK